jgi:hypothetical protein
MEWLDGYQDSKLKTDLFRIISGEDVETPVRDTVDSIIWSFKAYFLRYVSPI